MIILRNDGKEFRDAKEYGEYIFHISSKTVQERVEDIIYNPTPILFYHKATKSVALKKSIALALHSIDHYIMCNEAKIFKDAGWKWKTWEVNFMSIYDIYKGEGNFLTDLNELDTLLRYIDAEIRQEFCWVNGGDTTTFYISSVHFNWYPILRKYVKKCIHKDKISNITILWGRHYSDKGAGNRTVHYRDIRFDRVNAKDFINIKNPVYRYLYKEKKTPVRRLWELYDNVEGDTQKLVDKYIEDLDEAWYYYSLG